MARAAEDHIASNPHREGFDEHTRHLLPWAKESVDAQREAKIDLRRKKKSPGAHTRQGVTVG